MTTPARPVPAPDEVSAEFWRRADLGELVVQRCGRCTRFQHPPVAACGSCGADDLAFQAVSGRGIVHSVSVSVNAARHPAFAARQPYLVAFVSLDEQDDLLLVSNLPGADPDTVRPGDRVEVVFERLESGTSLPQFRPVR